MAALSFVHAAEHLHTCVGHTVVCFIVTFLQFVFFLFSMFLALFSTDLK